MIKFLTLIPLLVAGVLASPLRADMIVASAMQANQVEDSVGLDLRAVYLGRLNLADFSPSIPASANSFSEIRAVVTIIDAQGVQLYLGNGNSGFFANQANFHNTSLAFSNTTNNTVQTFLGPALPPAPPAPLPLSAQGSLFSQLTNNGYLDAWLVGDGGAGLRNFNAPSQSIPLPPNPPTNIMFSVQLNAVNSNAVPEPSALAVALPGLYLMLTRRRRRSPSILRG